MSVKLTTEQMNALGLPNAGVGERDRFLQQIGRRVFADTMQRLLQSFTTEQMEALNHAIDSLDSFDAVITYLHHTYPQFETYLSEAERAVVDVVEADIRSTQHQ